MSDQFFVVSNIYHTADGYDSAALVTGSSQLPTGAKLLGLIAENVSGNTAWVQIHDGYAAPAANAVPLVSIRVAANSQVTLDPSAFKGVSVSTGIVVALSTTNKHYASAGANMWLSAFWI